MTAPGFSILLLTHPGLGEGLLEAARSIVGGEIDAEVITNRGLSPEELDRRVAAWVDARHGPAIILTDLGFGSCCQAARRLSRNRDDVGVLAGVNLPLLLAALRSRDLPDLGAVVRHLAERGKGSVEAYLGGSPA